MIRFIAASLLLGLFGCGRERPDPRLAEATSPIHATVRVIDVAVEKNCAGATTTEQLSCLISRADRFGCIYLEVGAAADTPQKTRQPDGTRCDSMASTGARVLLRNSPGKKATLFVEPGGARVVVDLVEAVHTLYLREGQVVINRVLWNASSPPPGGLRRPDGTLEWSLIPPFLSVLDEVQLRSLSEAELDGLLAKTPGGKSALKQSLLQLTDSYDVGREAWGRAISRLEPSDQAELREAMIGSVSGGSQGALVWFIAHPEQQGPDFITALGEAVASGSLDLATSLPPMLMLDPKTAERVACEHLERKWHENTSSIDNYGFIPPEPAALAVIVAQRSKCPWVLPLLERTACNWALRCDPDVEDKKETPLCDAAQRAAALERTLHPQKKMDDEEQHAVESDWGALLLSASLLQGPLPPSLEHANERRQYTLDYTFKGPEEDDPCRQLMEEPGDWACRLPQAVNVSTNEACKLVVDDAKKTMTLTPTAVPL